MDLPDFVSIFSVHFGQKFLLFAITCTEIDVYDLPRFFSVELVEFFLILILFMNAYKCFFRNVFDVFPKVRLQQYIFPTVLHIGG